MGSSALNLPALALGSWAILVPLICKKESSHSVLSTLKCGNGAVDCLGPPGFLCSQVGLEGVRCVRVTETGAQCTKPLFLPLILGEGKN